MPTGILAQAMVGLGEGVREVGLDQMKAAILAERDQRLNEFQTQHQERGFKQEEKMVDLRENVRRTGRQSDIDQDVDPENVRKRVEAASATITGTIPAKVQERKELGAADLQLEINKFDEMEPRQRKAAISAEVEKMKAMTTPEMLKATRAKAQAMHIVDPNYSLIPTAEGLVMYDTKSGTNKGLLKGEDGKPLTRRDPDELKSIATVVNAANQNLARAETEYKTSMNDIAASNEQKAGYRRALEEAKREAKMVREAAYPLLFNRAKGDFDMPTSDTPTREPSPAAIDALKKNRNNPKILKDFQSYYGVDPKNFLTSGSSGGY